MPEHCAAYSCSNRRTIANKTRGITFHKFPKDKDLRKKWEVALRREGFTASVSSVLCSQHFKQGDFDRTGQIVRLRDGVIPSVFNFPVHLQRLEKGRTTATSRRAEESLSVASQDSLEMPTSHPQPHPNDDHGYALPASPTALKTRLNEALARVESLEREKKNAMAREKRAKTTVKSLLGDDSMSSAEEHPSPFANISALVCDHSYLPTWFGGLVENTLVYIAGFVVRQILRFCLASFVRDVVPSSFDKSYHLLALTNNGGLVIPSQGRVKVLTTAERLMRRASTVKAPKVSTVTHIVREKIGTEDVFLLGDTLRRHSLASTTINTTMVVSVSQDKAAPHC